MNHMEDKIDPGETVAGGWVHQPAPDHTGSDERDRHGEEKYTAKDVLTLGFLFEQDGQSQPDNQAACDEQDSEHSGVADIDNKAWVVIKQVDVLFQSNPGVISP